MRVNNLLNGAALALGLVAIVFKSQAWAGADLLLLVSFVLLLASALGFTLRTNAEVGTPPALSYAMVATLAVGILGVMFRSLHWKGGFLLAVATGVLLVALSIMLITARTATVSRQFMATFMVYVALLAAILNVAAYRTPHPAPVAAVSTGSAGTE